MLPQATMKTSRNVAYLAVRYQQKLSLMKLAIIFICLAFLLASCHHKHRACANTNPVFTQYSPDDREYKAELIRQLSKRDPSRIHYFIEKYLVRARKPFMMVEVEGDSLCAKMMLDIKNENKMQDFKTVAGLSYTGAELIGLQYAIDSSYGSYNFLFEEGVIQK